MCDQDVGVTSFIIQDQDGCPHTRSQHISTHHRVTCVLHFPIVRSVSPTEWKAFLHLRWLL